MSKFNWRNGFALGLTVGICTAIIILVGSKPAIDFANCANSGHCEGYADKYRNSGIPDTWWWDWKGHIVTSGDTLAQWIMTFFSILAVGLIWQTLRQTNKTNDAAVAAAKAANEANAIMRHEQRPWVTIRREIRCDVHDLGHGVRLSWNYDLVNKGKSPAYDIKLEWMAVKRSHIQKMDIEAKDYAQRCLSKNRMASARVIFPGEEKEYLRYQFGGHFTYAYDQTNTAEIPGGYLVVFVCVTYKLSLQSDEFGAEVIAVGFEQSKAQIGPFTANMLEYAHARYMQ